jgi:hypothetical protein
MLGFFMRIYKILGKFVRLFLHLLELTNIVTIPPKGNTITSPFGPSSAKWLFFKGIVGHLTRNLGCGYFFARLSG